MALKLKHLSKLLSQEQNEEEEEEGETFELVYRGNSELDRHYTKPMLPWIISEIKNQHKLQQVSVIIKNGYFEVRDKTNQNTFLTHTIKQIHKCVMEQADHRCFLYTLRMTEKQNSLPDVLETSTTPLPCNIPINQNYQCHLYQALTEQEVRNFFACLRQQPKETKMQDSDSFNSLADLSVHTESQFFEVLFVGRVKVSHCKVPVTFIDEALAAFQQKEKSRQRHASGENKRYSPSRIMSFQQEGSGYSVPNISLRSLGDGETHILTRAASKELGSGEFIGKTDKETKVSKVRFDLGSSCEEPPDMGSPIGGLSPQSSISSCSSSQPFQMELKEMGKDSYWNTYNLKSFPQKGINECDNGGLTKGDTEKLPSEPCLNKMEETLSNEQQSLLTIEPFHQRTRNASGNNVSKVSTPSEPGLRERSGSIGSTLSRHKYLRPSESDLKALGYDFNRTMLFHIGHREIQLINPELKSVQLHKPFKDVAGCCQGVKANDHFGFICRELSGDIMVYVGYIFRCEKNAVADEIMQALNRAFAAMHEAHQRDRKEHLMCDFCPLKWFSQLCGEVEGLPAQKAHVTIMKRISSLPEEEREIIIAKYEGAETSELAQKNNVLMLLLRTHFEYKQSNHSHPSESSTNAKSDFQIGTNIESSLKKAGQSIKTSFSHLLKRDQKDGESSEKESHRPVEDHSTVNQNPQTNEKQSTAAATSTFMAKSPTSSPSCVLEGISDSPLRSYRQRSSTVSGAGGDSMRKEFLAKKALAAKRENEENSQLKPATFQKNSSQLKRNIFLKFGPPSIPPPPPPPPPKAKEDVHDIEDEESYRPSTSFRHAILQKVVSPAKGMLNDTQNRKISCGKLGKLDKFAIQFLPKRDIDQLMIVWKKAIFQQILLNRIERENQRLRAMQKEAALQRVRLNYEEEDLTIDAQQAWEMLLSRPQARIDPNILASGIKQGIPKSVRGEVWNLLMIQQQLFQLSPLQKQSLPHNFDATYEDMLKELTSQHHAILIDLGRTFPSHPYFTQTLGPGQLALFNILKAYSILDQEVGYCQGLSFVGGVLLMHVEEELAYQLLKHLMYNKGCRKQYLPDLDGLQIRMYQLSRLFHDKLNDLYNHLEENEVTPQLYAAPWFLTLFASQYPINFVVRVFDLLFLNGMETVFCVALVLLQTHEENLMAIDGFEQIMEYFKSTVTNIETSHLPSFFAEVCECDVRKELCAYEVEYQVLQEELSLSPQQDADLQKLKEASRNLKRQNLDLLEKLQSANARQNALEASNQSLQQSQHHLEVRVRWLEMERCNMRQLINILCNNGTMDMFDAVPANLERYLPHKASSPMREDRRQDSIKLPENSSRSSLPREIGSPPTDIYINVPRQNSLNPIRNIEEKENYGHLAPVILCPEPIRKRSSTLDPKAMQNYFRSFIHSD